MPGAKARPGRPPTFNAKDTATRSREYRARQRNKPKTKWHYVDFTKKTLAQLRQLVTRAHVKGGPEGDFLLVCACGVFQLWERTTDAIQTEQRVRDRNEFVALIGRDILERLDEAMLDPTPVGWPADVVPQQAILV